MNIVKVTKGIIVALLLSCAGVISAQSASPLLQPWQFFPNQAGLPCANCLLYSYAAGTTTPQPTYTDASGSIQNANPVVLDARGTATVWLGPNPYKFVLQTAGGVTVKTVDNVPGSTVIPASQSFLGSNSSGHPIAAPYTPANKAGDTFGSTDYLPHGMVSLKSSTCGAKGDTQIKNGGGSISSSSTTFTASSGIFTSADVGKVIIIQGAAAAGAHLHTTIGAYISATQVTLAVAASTTVSNTQFLWGTDDTGAINTCFSYALPRGLSVYGPTGAYLVTKSLNATVSNGVAEAGLWFRGDATGLLPGGGVFTGTTLVDALTEAYPLIDWGGDKFTGWTDMQVWGCNFGYGASLSCTQSTAVGLWSQGNWTTTQAGDQPTVDNVLVSGSTGDCSGCGGFVFAGADGVMLKNSAAGYGGIVSGRSLGRSTAVASKFYNLSLDLPSNNPTISTFINTAADGDYVPPIQLTGSGDYSMYGGGAAIIGNSITSPIAIEVTSPTVGGTSANHLHIVGFRLENQSLNFNSGDCNTHPTDAGCSMTELMIGSATQGPSRTLGGYVGAQWTADNSGYTIGTAGSGSSIEGLVFNPGAETNNYFNLGAGAQIINDTFYIEGATSVGTVPATSGWNNATFYIGGNATLTQSALETAIAGSSGSGGIQIFKNGTAGPFMMGNFTWQTGAPQVAHGGTAYNALDASQLTGTGGSYIPTMASNSGFTVGHLATFATTDGRLQDGGALPTTATVQRVSLTSGICTTTTTAYNSCTQSITWPNAFADTGYSVTCTGFPPTSGLFYTLYVSAKSTTGATVTLQNGDASGAAATTTSEIDCIGVHP